MNGVKNAVNVTRIVTPLVYFLSFAARLGAKLSLYSISWRKEKMADGVTIE